MATEQPKTAPTPEHPYPPPPVPYPPFNGATYGPHPPGTYPSFFPYPQPLEATSGENSAPPPGYTMMFTHPPPGMVFAFTPPQNPGYPPPQPPPMPNALSRPKRKQVKMACTNCATACKRCDENRPCERCKKYGITETCVDGQRKERKKGIKRGPYKRKNKGSEDSSQFPETAAEGEWPAGGPPPTTNPATTVAAIQAVAHQFPNGEGFYHPIYYPPHGPASFLPPPPHPHDVAEGLPAHPNGQPPPVPYYIHGAYPPPFGHYAPFLHGTVPHPPPQPHTPIQPTLAPTTVDPAATSSADSKVVIVNGSQGTTPAPVENGSGKKRSRRSKAGAEAKAKKAKRGPKSPKGAETEVEVEAEAEVEVEGSGEVSERGSAESG